MWVETKSTGTFFSTQCWIKRSTQAACAVAGPPTRRRRSTALRAVGRHIVQVVVGFLFRLSGPEVDVWFVPNLEVPIRHFLDAVPLYQVAREKENELVPLPGIARGSHVRMIPKWVRAWSFCHLLRHKAEFDKGSNPNLQQTVINQVNAREIQTAGCPRCSDCQKFLPDAQKSHENRYT